MKHNLNSTAVKAAKSKDKLYKLWDGGGLYLEVKPNGTRTWRYKYRLLGKEKVFTVGPYPEFSLAQARVAHKAARECLAAGVDPVAHRQQVEREKAAAAAVKQNTFTAVSEQWLLTKEIKPNTLRQLRSCLDYLQEFIGDTPIAEVPLSDFRDALDAISSRNSLNMAKLCRLWGEQVFRWAIHKELTEDNPALLLRKYLPKSKTPEHHRSLDFKDVPAFVRDLEAYTGTFQAKAQLKLLLLLFVRPSELRLAEWSEFDLKGAVWRIPKHRMKADREHRVPLSAQAVRVLKELKKYCPSDVLLFPNQRDTARPMSITSLNRVLQRIGWHDKTVAHGFRGLASTELREIGFPGHLVEFQLAHAVGGAVERSYNAAEYWPDRVGMMQQWADMVLPVEKGKVVPMKKRKA
jgi:integrase